MWLGSCHWFAIEGSQGVSACSDPAVEVLDGFRQAAGVLGLVRRKGGSPVLFCDDFPAAARGSGGGKSVVVRDGDAESDKGMVCPGDW